MQIDLSNAEHYLWGTGCEGWHLLKNPELSVIAERVPPGASETRHIHHQARQFFFILQGKAVIEMEGQRFALGPHQGLEVPPGCAHQFFNDADQDVHFLVISQPSTRGDREESGPSNTVD